MARKPKTAPVKGELPTEELQRVVKEYERQTASASEYSGRAGQAIKSLIDRYNVNPKAFRFILTLSRMEETKRQATLRGLIELAYKLGMFDAVDAFDDIVSKMEAICEEIRERADKPRATDPIVSSLVQ